MNRVRTLVSLLFGLLSTVETRRSLHRAGVLRKRPKVRLLESLEARSMMTGSPWAAPAPNDPPMSATFAPADSSPSVICRTNPAAEVVFCPMETGTLMEAPKLSVPGKSGPNTALEADAVDAVWRVGELLDPRLVAAAKDGDLDATFGTGGKVRTNFAGFDYAEAVAVDSQGRIIVVGNGGDDFGIARYLSDGKLDKNFGTNGLVRVNFGGVDVAKDVQILSDGRILVVGAANNQADFGLVMLKASGAVDTSFGASGKVVTNFSGVDYAEATAIDSQGRIVVAGNGGADFGIARYTANGKLDASFGNGGQVRVNFGGVDAAKDVRVLDDGRILVVGAANNEADFGLLMLKANGALDTAFGAGGKVLTNFSGTDYAEAVAIDSQGRIVVVGNGGDDFGVARYLANGKLDTSFGSSYGALSSGFGGAGSGMVRINFGGVDAAKDVKILSDGRILVVGAANNQADFGLMVLKDDGSLDPTFGNGGKVVTNFSGTDYAEAAAIDGEGRIVVVGNGGDDFGVARYMLAKPNLPPVAPNKAYQGVVGDKLTIPAADLLAGVSDPNGDLFQLFSVSGAVWNKAAGTVTLNLTKAGATEFSYTVKDARGLTGTGKVTVTVVANSPPITPNKSGGGRVGDTITISVAKLLEGVYDPNGDPIELIKVTGATWNKATGTVTATLTKAGVQTFAYTVKDSRGATSTGMYSIVVAENRAPIAPNQNFTGVKGDTWTIPASQLLQGVTDPDGDAIELVTVAGASFNKAAGTVTVALSKVGEMKFTYTVKDSRGATATGAVAIKVTDNLPPVAPNKSFNGVVGDKLVIPVSKLLEGVGDPNGDAVELVKVTGATYSKSAGTVTLVLSKEGVVNFTYTVKDARGATSSGTVKVTCTANLPPTNLDKNFTANVGEKFTISVSQLLAGVVDPNGDAVSLVRVTGAIYNQAAGTVTLDLKSPGERSFAYTVKDSRGATATGTVKINVLGGLLAPSGLTAAAVDATSVNLTWTDNASTETGYRIAMSKDGGKTWNSVGEVKANQTTFRVGNLSAKTTYLFQVRATDGKAFSGYSNVLTVTTAGPAAPIAPSSLRAAETGSKYVTLTWNDLAKNESGYRVAISRDGGKTWNNVAELPANTTKFRVTDLNPNSRYMFKVRAVNDGVFSDYSNTLEVTTKK